MIEAADVHKSYGSLEVLKGVSLTVCRGEVVCIVGASGAVINAAARPSADSAVNRLFTQRLATASVC